jgi:hypothetical protein
VGLHDFVLLIREATRLLQDGIRNADLADVVHRSCEAKLFGLRYRPAGRPGQGLAEESRANDVGARFFIAAHRSGHEPMNRFFVRFTDCLRLRDNPLLERLRIGASFDP